MVIFIVEAVPPNVRGALSKWAIEPRAGVFVANISARVRDQIWEMLNEDKKLGATTLIYNDNTEAGYTIRTQGINDRRLVNFEGLQLVARQHRRPRNSSLTTETDPI